MATFDLNDDSVVCIIGSGAGGGTLGNELAQKGIKVVILEAGGRHEIPDFVNDEWASFAQLAWKDMRTTSGTWRVAHDFPNLPAWIVKSVGGSTVHWAGASLRFQEYEFKARSTYGNMAGASLADWPITLAEMEPWYAKAEDKMGTTGPTTSRACPATTTTRCWKPARASWATRKCTPATCRSTASRGTAAAPVSRSASASRAASPAASGPRLYTEIPKGEATGNLEVRPNAMAMRIEHDAQGKVTGVVYVDAAGKQQRQKARVVAVAGNSLESPRLLLNSESAKYPQGLANSSGQVGRNYMRHTTGSVYAVFDKPVHMYRGTTMAGIVRDEARNDPKRGFVGGYELETLSLGLPFMAAFLNPGAWGRSFTSAIDDYSNMAGLWIVGEDMPREQNRVTLDPKVKDANGMPVASVHFDDHENDEKMRNHAYRQGAAIYDAVGAVRTFPTPPYPSTHNLGTNRMSANARDGVVNKWGQTHDIKNLFVSDGSQFTTGAACNPTLTIVALAIRQADAMAGMMSRKEI